MSGQWQRVDPIDGYERMYHNGAVRVAYKHLEPNALYVHRDLFTEESLKPTPLPPVHVENPDFLTDEFYFRSLQSVAWHISGRRLPTTDLER